MLSHSLAADVCFFSESDFKSFPMKLVYKFSTGCVMRWKQGLEVVVINSWNKQLVPIEHVLVLLSLQDVFLAFFFSREEKIKSQLYSAAACHALWKTFPITLLPSMHSTCSVVFLQFMWQRNVLECVRAVRLLSLERETGFLLCLHVPHPCFQQSCWLSAHWPRL